MQVSSLGKQKVKKICTLLLGFSIIFLGLVFCGGIPNYTYSYKVSSGLCQGQNATPVAGEQTLAIAAVSQSNITICMVRASDGSLLRHYDLPIHGDIMGQGDGFLYILERSDEQGNAFALCAVHIHDGLVRWCQTQLKNYNTGNPSNQLQINNGTLYLRYAYQDEKNQEQNVLTAVNEQTGQVLWNVHTFQPSTAVNYELLALTPKIVYVNASQVLPADQPVPTNTTLNASSVCALRASTGQQLWCKSVATAELLINGMIADENTLYVQMLQNASLSALNAADGSLRWQKSFSQGDFSPPNPPTTPLSLVLVHGTIIIQMPDNLAYSQLYALRSSDGQQLWNTSSLNSVVFPSSLAATQTLVYAISPTGNTHAFNILDGTPLWSYDNSSLQNVQGNHFLVQQNMVYLSLRSRLYTPFILVVLNTHDGTPRWTCTTNPYLSQETQISTPQIDSTYPLCFQQTADVYRKDMVTSLQLLQVDVDQ